MRTYPPAAVLFLAPALLFADAARDAEIARQAEALRPKLVEMRRDFHMHPELSNREERTSRVIAERLRALGFEDVKTGVASHGVVALLKGAKPGPVVAVRADMDALPVEETLDVPYKSRNAGVKHACGHDVHMAVQLGVAEILSKMRANLPGSVKFIFQPAEEGAPKGEQAGARQMVKEGALDNPRPIAIFGLHTEPSLQAGQLGFVSGPMLSSADRFTVRIKGKKSHAAWPHLGIDPIVVASEAVLALQTIRSRRIDPQDPIVLTIGKIEGGNRENIIADEVRLLGTIRTLNEDTRSRIEKLMREVLGGITSAHGASYEMDLERQYSVTTNPEPLASLTRPAMERIAGKANVVVQKPVSGAEDFSEFQKVIPGFFYWLGVANRQRGITASLHTADYDVDEESLVVGVKAMTAIAVDALERGR
jgi:amidohydrolase